MFEKIDTHIYILHPFTFSQNLSKDTLIQDITGKEMKAMDIISFGIKYLKEEMQRFISSSDSIDESEVKFVLTVPAIWDDAAKQFMIEAAIKVYQSISLYKKKKEEI